MPWPTRNWPREERFSASLPLLRREPEIGHAGDPSKVLVRDRHPAERGSANDGPGKKLCKAVCFRGLRYHAFKKSFGTLTIGVEHGRLEDSPTSRLQFGFPRREKPRRGSPVPHAVVSRECDGHHRTDSRLPINRHHPGPDLAADEHTSRDENRRRGPIDWHGRYLKCAGRFLAKPRTRK